MRVAFDENVPIAMVRVFQALAKERRIREVVGDLEIESAADYTPKPGDLDHKPNNDEPWIRRFARAGGHVIISGNTAMATVPHERLALVEERFVVIFFEPSWSNLQFFRKCAHLLHWWPVIAKAILKAKRPSFWRVPNGFTEDGELRHFPHEDQKLLKIERQKAAQPAKAADRKASRAPTSIKQLPLDLGDPNDPRR